VGKPFNNCPSCFQLLVFCLKRFFPIIFKHFYLLVFCYNLYTRFLYVIVKYTSNDYLYTVIIITIYYYSYYSLLILVDKILEEMYLYVLLVHIWGRGNANYIIIHIISLRPADARFILTTYTCPFIKKHCSL